MKEMIKCLVCRPEKVTFGMKEFLIWERDLDEKLTCRTIPYDTMVLAYPEAYRRKDRRDDSAGDSGDYRKYEGEFNYLGQTAHDVSG